MKRSPAPSERSGSRPGSGARVCSTNARARSTVSKGVKTAIAVGLPLLAVAILVPLPSAADHMTTGPDGPPTSWPMDRLNAKGHRAVPNGDVTPDPWLDWSQDLAIGGMGSAAKDGIVVTATNKGTGADLIAWNGSTGEELWRESHPDGWEGEPGISGTTVIAGSDGHNRGPRVVVGLDLYTGERKWTFEIPGSGIPNTAVVVHDGKAFVPTDQFGEVFYTLDVETGELLWSTDVGISSERPPAVAEGRVYLPGDHSVYALSESSGEILWKRQLDGQESGVLYHEGNLYVGDQNGHLSNLDPSDGSVQWRMDMGKAKSIVGSVSRGFLYDVGSAKVTKVDLADQEILWERNLPDVTGPASTNIVDETLIVGIAGSGSKVVALDTSDGRIRWEWDTSYKVVDLMYVNGRIHVDTNGGQTAGTHLAIGTKQFTELEADPVADASDPGDSSASIHLKATLTEKATGEPLPGEVVRFEGEESGTPLCEATTDSRGEAQCTFEATGPVEEIQTLREEGYQAIFGGNDQFLPSRDQAPWVSTPVEPNPIETCQSLAPPGQVCSTLGDPPSPRDATWDTCRSIFSRTICELVPGREPPGLGDG